MAKELTLKEHAAEQLKRLKHIRGFPTESLALRDYCMALMLMETFEGVTTLMDELTQTDWISCPTAANIRRMAYERTEDLRKRRKTCEECGGSGFRTIWILVTYHGKSLSPKRHERLPQVKSEGDRNDFCRVLQVRMAEALDQNPNIVFDNQMVVSAAEDCSCRKRVTVLQ